MENEICHLKLDEVIPNKYQPREIKDEESLNELASSVKQHGVIQPIIVRRNGDKYEIVDGYRRYQASLIAGLIKIPALLRNYDDKEAVRISLIDNLQRKDLSPIEEARAYKHLLEIDGMKQEQLASSLGKSQSTIANKIRLLNLPLEVQDALLKNEISERHARSLLSISNIKIQIELLKKIIEKRMTVRELDGEIKNMSNMFIPEEYSNNNANLNSGVNNSGNQFIPSFNEPINPNEGFMINSNNDNGVIPPIPPVDKPINSFMPNDYNRPIDGGNNYQRSTFMPNNYDISNQNNLNNNDYANNVELNNSNRPMMDMNNERQNPFLANQNVVPPLSTNNNNSNFNPFSSIRISSNQKNTNYETQPTPTIEQSYGYVESETPDFTNLQSPVSDNSFNMDDNSSNFNINDYKLPGMEYENQNNNDVAPINATPVNNTNDFKYIENNPNYVSVDKPQMISSIDEVIDLLQETLFKIKNSKLKVETEETDYDDLYEIVIKIDKKGSF